MYTKNHNTYIDTPQKYIHLLSSAHHKITAAFSLTYISQNTTVILSTCAHIWYNTAYIITLYTSLLSHGYKQYILAQTIPRWYLFLHVYSYLSSKSISISLTIVTSSQGLLIVKELLIVCFWLIHLCYLFPWNLLTIIILQIDFQQKHACPIMATTYATRQDIKPIRACPLVFSFPHSRS
mgnify:CR=1 FL=1